MGPLELWILIFFIWAGKSGGLSTLKCLIPLMTQRAFVLVPLLEIAENLVEPQTGQAYKNILSQIDTSDVRKLEQVD